MGKLSRKQAVNMLNDGTITQESFDKMEDAGQIIADYTVSKSEASQRSK